jgi:two-component system alkaline phosphatase synthesis response regulator PhoP
MTGERSVLVVDDSALIRQVAQLGLAEPGWRVTTVDSGAEAIEVAGRERPDAILLDVVMPDLDGPATLARLRSEEPTRDIPVVFLTAKAEDTDRRELEDLGAAGVIAKPFDPGELAGQVAQTLGWSQ